MTMEQQIDVSREKPFDPSPLTQNDKVTNSSLSQMFAKAHCSSSHSEGMLKLLQLLVTISVEHQVIQFWNKITNLLRTES